MLFVNSLTVYFMFFKLSAACRLTHITCIQIFSIWFHCFKCIWFYSAMVPKVGAGAPWRGHKTQRGGPQDGLQKTNYKNNHLELHI